MSNIRLFFKESLSLNLNSALDRSQSHYLSKVMRINTGENFSLFNQSGAWEAKVDNIIKGISEFSGVGRRYEKHNIEINQKKIVLIDDYGHHPLEIDSNINAYREEFPNKKVCMIFQPHRFSRTAQLFDDFIRVLNKADSLILLDIYSASEKPIRGIHSRTIVETIKQLGHQDVTYLKNHDDVINLVNHKKDSFDILVTQGAGSISKVCLLYTSPSPRD